MTTETRSHASPIAALSAPALRRYLEAYVRRRVPPSDADDAIQSVLCAALEATRIPTDGEELRKWVTGIARHKIAAHYQRSSRERVTEVPEIEASAAPLEASSLLRWAQRQAASIDEGQVDETLDWMAREGDGEKLETIASEARVPAARVRKRVSRLRRFMRARWAAELALIAGALIAIAWTSWWLWGRAQQGGVPRVAPDPSSIASTQPAPSPIRLATDARERALLDCRAHRYAQCLQLLDGAARLDPAGDAAPAIGEARRLAHEALRHPAPKPPAPMHAIAPRTTSTSTPTSMPTPRPSGTSMTPTTGGGTPSFGGQ